MPKRMMHPKHGWTHVYSPQEEEFHRKNGWVDDVPEAPGATGASEEDQIDDLRAKLDAMGVTVDRRWGLKTLQEQVKRHANSR